jgi:uncharacterized damage-inducible protein DinB
MAMHIAPLLVAEFDTEMPVTRRVLERVPDDDGGWRPHPKSFPIAHLAQLVARMPAWTAMIATRDGIDFAPKDGPKFPGYSIEKTATLLVEFDKNVAAGRTGLAGVTDDQFQQPWTTSAGGRVISTTSRYEAMRALINHIVHHRAQLGIYLRLRDVPVPSMYGPTADERM